MNKTTEKNIIFYSLNNLLKQPESCDLRRLYDWFEEISPELIGIDVEVLWTDRRKTRWHRDDEEDRDKLPRDYKTMRKFLAGTNDRLPIDPVVSAIIEAFRISPKYHEVFAMRVYTAMIPALTRLVDTHQTGLRRRIAAKMAGVSLWQYEKSFAAGGELVEKGLFELHLRYDDDLRIDITRTLQDVVFSHCRSARDVRQTILGKPLKTTLKPRDFDHVAEEFAWLKTLLSNAVSKREQGVNVLIYGNPGTGKTELAKSLCREIGASLYSVSSRHAEERNDRERRNDLAAALCLLQDNQNSVLLMDEAEDVFAAASEWNVPFKMSYSKSPPKSKLFFNRLLETNTVPVIWVCNSVRGVDPAHLRRFAYTLKLDAPDETTQARIWAKSARKNKVKIPKLKIEELAKSYDIAPAIIDASLRTAALTNDLNAIEKTIDALLTAMNGRVSHKKKEPEIDFNTSLLHCDTDLEKLTQRIVNMKGVNFSLCLYGASGTGKSAYARHLAGKLKMKVLHKRASDLLNCYVGGTEGNIAEAFAEAHKKNGLLVFDEADGFLRDRRSAHRSWEVTQVNEMLTQMESHPLPFVCTTNLMDGLDPASMRRFTFKVKYDYLKPSQVLLAFEHFFDVKPTTKFHDTNHALHDLTHLTPGDFAVVAKRAKICGIDSPHELVELLRNEQNIKEVRCNRLGFDVPD